MNVSSRQPLRSTRRLLAGAAVGAALVAALIGWSRPEAILPAYRLALFICFAPAAGSLLFTLVHRSTGGKWGDILRPFLATGAQLAPWIWLFVLPLLFATPETPASWPDYESTGMRAIRAVGYAAVLFALTAPLGRSRSETAPAWLGPVGLIVLVFTLHFLADDWLAALDPGWHSTAFPLVWMLGQAVSGLGCAVLIALLCGISPRAAPAIPSEALGLDWGNLLLTATLLWCYVAFGQFLIIWGGNLPREISWFIRRAHGGWRIMPALLAVFHFAVPLALLLSRRLKRSRAGLGAAAALLLAAQVLFLAWMILPVLSSGTGWSHALAPVLGIGALALFFHRYLTVATRRFEQS